MAVRSKMSLVLSSVITTGGFCAAWRMPSSYTTLGLLELRSQRTTSADTTFLITSSIMTLELATESARIGVKPARSQAGALNALDTRKKCPDSYPGGSENGMIATHLFIVNS